MKMTKELFCSAVRMLIRLENRYKELCKMGFNIDNSPAGNLGHDIDAGLADLNVALGLQKVEGYTTLDWWWENRDNERESRTLKFYGAGAPVEELCVDSPSDLWDAMVKLGEIEND